MKNKESFDVLSSVLGNVPSYIRSFSDDLTSHIINNNDMFYTILSIETTVTYEKAGSFMIKERVRYPGDMFILPDGNEAKGYAFLQSNNICDEERVSSFEKDDRYQMFEYESPKINKFSYKTKMAIKKDFLGCFFVRRERKRQNNPEFFEYSSFDAVDVEKNEHPHFALYFCVKPNSFDPIDESRGIISADGDPAFKGTKPYIGSGVGNSEVDFVAEEMEYRTLIKPGDLIDFARTSPVYKNSRIKSFGIDEVSSLPIRFEGGSVLITNDQDFIMAMMTGLSDCQAFADRAVIFLLNSR